jgi:CRP/FNR family cyclic AMP-dependent transcriptional regulator
VVRGMQEADVGLKPHAVSYVRLADVDPLLLCAVPSDIVERLRSVLTVPLVPVSKGGGVPYTASTGDGLLGLLILEGLLVRAVTIAERRTVELLGPGDLIRPWQDEGRLAVLPARCAWTALEATQVAVLNHDFAAVAYRFDAIAEELMSRMVARCHMLSERLAIATIPLLPERLMTLLWHLADRWGRVEPGGVVVPLRLSHQLLAELACAQRPSVTVALQRLVAEGRVARTAAGGWLLRGRMPRHEPGQHVTSCVS